MWDFIDGPSTQCLYETLLEEVRDKGRVVAFPYRCDSPLLRRRLHLTMSPADQAGTVRFRSITLQEEPRLPIVVGSCCKKSCDKLLPMCSWCKRVRIERKWVEIERALIELGVFEGQSVPGVTHGACPECSSRLLKSYRDRASLDRQRMGLIG